jgi:hypothetical protein
MIGLQHKGAIGCLGVLGAVLVMKRNRRREPEAFKLIGPRDPRLVVEMAIANGMTIEELADMTGFSIERIEGLRLATGWHGAWQALTLRRKHMLIARNVLGDVDHLWRVLTHRYFEEFQTELSIEAALEWMRQPLPMDEFSQFMGEMAGQTPIQLMNTDPLRAFAAAAGVDTNRRSALAS